MKLQTIKVAVVDFFSEEDGATAVEYAVMLALILIVCIVAVAFMGKQNADSLDNSATAISSAVNN